MSCRPSLHTCDSNELRELQEAMHGVDRRTLIFAAGALNNRNLLQDLGSQESANWYEGQRAVDPGFTNPYWPDKG